MRREVSCQRLAAESIRALPMEEQVAGGHSLGPLRVTAAPAQRLTLEPETTAAQFAPCTLREGTHVRFSRNTPTSPAAHAVLLGQDSAGFHFIFIDEARFFARIGLPPVLGPLAAGDQLFLAADPTQGFRKRRQSWLAAGIEVRGRAARLSVPHRSTRAILEFAVDRLTGRRPLHPAIAADDLDPPDAAGLLAVPVDGEAPRVVQTPSAQDSLATVVKIVAALGRQSPWLAGSVLVLHADSRATGTVIAILRRHLGPDQVRDFGDKCDPAGFSAFCAVSNLKAATGLEAAVVFLLAIERLLAREADPRQARSGAADLIS